MKCRSAVLSTLRSSALRGLVLVLSCFLLLSFVLSLAQGDGATDEEDFQDLFARIDQRLNSSYFDLDRVQPRPLVERALSSLELSADEIYVDSFDPAKPYVHLHIEDKVEAYNLNDIRNRRDSVKLLEQVFEFVGRHYRGESTLNELRYVAANGYLSGIDPHTLVFPPKDFEEFEIQIKGEIYGVGMMVGGTEDGRLEVKQVLKDTPAYRADFKKGDVIAKINDESTINMTVMEAVQKIRGPKDSELVLTVKRKSQTDKNVLETFPISVKRDLVTIKSVESKLITEWGDTKTTPKGGIGYIKVDTFDQKTAPSLAINLARLTAANGGALAGLIIDLRWNSGGLLTQAVQMADTFLKSGDIVITAKKGDHLQRTSATFDSDEPEYPIIMLANESSASGAEIVLGALQKNNRSLVLGTRTFGKGSVQQLQGLPLGAQLKITVSEYLIPGQISIQENGVVPDIEAVEVTLEDDYTDLFPTESVHKEKDYETHIVSKYKRDEQPRYTIKYLSRPPPEDNDDQPTARERFISGELAPETDPLVQMALQILEFGVDPFDPQAFLDRDSSAIDRLRGEFYTKIVEHLKTLGIDWSKAEGETEGQNVVPKEGDVELELSYELLQEPSTDKEDPVPENKLLVKATLTNKSDRALYRVKGISRSGYQLYEDHEFLFGKVDAGKSVLRTRKVRLPYFPRAQSNVITVDVSGDDDRVFLSQALEANLPRKERPAFAYQAQLKSADGEPLEKLPIGEDLTLQLTIHNTGKGAAHKGVTILRNKAGRRIFLKKGRLEFSELGPGTKEDVQFLFDVRSGEDVDVYNLELVIFDSYSGETLTRELKILPAEKNGKAFENGVLFQPPVIAMKIVASKDSEKNVLATEQDEVTLVANIESKSSNFKMWVTTLPLTATNKTPDKLYFASSGGRQTFDISTRVQLTDGLNIISLVAKDTNGIENRQSLVVRKEISAEQPTVSAEKKSLPPR